MTEIKGTIGQRQMTGGVSPNQKISGSLNVSSGGRKDVISATTEEWNSKPTLISIKDAVYVYTDFDVVDGQPVPNIKIGDGQAYLIDLPFIASAGISQQQVDFWNNKVSASIDINDPENLIFSTE